jgi:hypothetical protein
MAASLGEYGVKDWCTQALADKVYSSRLMGEILVEHVAC